MPGRFIVSQHLLLQALGLPADATLQLASITRQHGYPDLLLVVDHPDLPAGVTVDCVPVFTNGTLKTWGTR